MYFDGKIEVELIPQGTIAARMRAAGAGMPAVYTSAGAGTIYSEGGIPIKYTAAKNADANNPRQSPPVQILSPPRETRTFHGTEYVLEEAMHADIALVKAWRGDTSGNLVFRGTSRNSNPDVAVSGKFCIAEVEEIVEVGGLDPDEVHLSGVYVDRVILSVDNEKRIERWKESNDVGEVDVVAKGRGMERIIKRAAKEFKDGMCVNLGIGKLTAR